MLLSVCLCIPEDTGVGVGVGVVASVGETNSRPEAGNKTPIRPSKLSKNSNSSDVIFSIPQELVNGGMEAGRGRKKEGGECNNGLYSSASAH